MAFCESWRAGFELELILGDLGDPRFEPWAEDPMDIASAEYCRAVAADLARSTGRRWLAAYKKQRRNGYFVYPEYDLDPLNWPIGLVAGVELVTPPLPLAEAEALRRQICEWVEDVGGEINTYSNNISQGSGWHINIDPGHEHRELDICKLLLGADELPVLLSSERYPSQYAAPQRHAYGVDLLRYVRDAQGRRLLDHELGNFLRCRGGRSKRFAINLGKLTNDYVELRHFGAEWFFRDEPLPDVLAHFLRASETTHASTHLLGRRLLATFDCVAAWLEPLIPRITCHWQESNPFGVNIVAGEVCFDGEPLAQASWSGAAAYTLLGKAGDYGPAIYDQAMPDLPFSLAVLALDVAEIRGRKLGRQPLLNKGFSQAIDVLARALHRADLLTSPQLEQSAFWTSHPFDEDRVAAEMGDATAASGAF